MKLLLILAMSLFLIHCSKSDRSAQSAGSIFCPDHYVGVPLLEGYTTNDFCVMKYEAKNDGSGNAISQASDRPYVNINRADSMTKCTSLGEGYDLITNDEWQTLARNIELVPNNWATGVIKNAGGLSRGHSDGLPDNALQASSDDTKGCEGTGQTCSNTIWDGQRRTHTLSTGEVIWDLAGNVGEWVKDNNEFKYGDSAYISEVTVVSHPTSNSLSHGTTTTARSAQAQFGPSENYTLLNEPPYGGLGYGFLNFEVGGIFRGGSWDFNILAGLFAVDLDSRPTSSNPTVGFRCVFHP